MGEAYKQLIREWRDVLPTQSLCLTVPVVHAAARPEASTRRHQRARAQQMIELAGRRARPQENRMTGEPRFEDKVAIVTGAAGGIGAAIAAAWPPRAQRS